MHNTTYKLLLGALLIPCVDAASANEVRLRGHTISNGDVSDLEPSSRSRNLRFNWLGEEWFGDDKDDVPSLLVLQRDRRFCLSAKKALVGPKQKLEPEPRAQEEDGRDPIILARCNPADTTQHFFLQHWERWRPADNLKMCVSISNSTAIVPGIQMKLEDCLKKNRGQRWLVNDYDEITPFESSGFCVSPVAADSGSVKLDVCRKSPGAGWDMVGANKYKKYLKSNPLTFDENSNEPYRLIVTNDDDWDSDDEQPKRKCLTANSNREAVMSNCDLSRSRQYWLVEDYAKSDTVRLRPKHNLGLCLHMSGALGDAYRWRERPVVRLKDCRFRFDNIENQQWSISDAFIHPQEEMNLCMRRGEDSSDSDDDAKNRMGRIQDDCDEDSVWHFVPPSQFVLKGLPDDILEKENFVRIEWTDKKNNKKVCIDGNSRDARECRETDKYGLDSRHQLWYYDDDLHLRPVDWLHRCLEYQPWQGYEEDDEDIGLKELDYGNCAMYKPYQKWRYDPEKHTISLDQDPTMCLTAKASVRCDDEEIRIGLSKCNGWESQRLTMNRHQYRCRETLDDSVFLVHPQPRESGQGYDRDRCGVFRIDGQDKFMQLDDCDFDDKTALWVMKNKHIHPLRDEAVCLDVLESEMPFAPPRLLKCDESKPSQQFIHDQKSGELKSLSLPDFCLSDGCSWRYSQGVCVDNCGSNRRRQKWAITSTSGYIPTPLTTPKTRYYIVSGDSDCGCFCCLQIDDEGILGVGSCQENLGRNFRQREWRKDERDRGFVLRKGSGCLTPGEANTRDCEDEEEDEEQLWQFNDSGNNEISPISQPGVCLSRRSMEMLPCTGDDDQSWEFLVSDGAPIAAQKRCDSTADQGFVLFVLKDDPRFCLSSLGREDGMSIKITACDPSSYEQLWATEGFEESEKQLRPLNNPATCMAVNTVDYLEAVRIEECRRGGYGNDDDDDNDDDDSDDSNDISPARKQIWRWNEAGIGEISPASNPSLCVSYDKNCELNPSFAYMLGLVSCGSAEDRVGFKRIKPEDYDAVA